MNIQDTLDWLLFKALTGLCVIGGEVDDINPVHDHGCELMPSCPAWNMNGEQES